MNYQLHYDKLYGWVRKKFAEAQSRIMIGNKFAVGCIPSKGVTAAVIKYSKAPEHRAALAERNKTRVWTKEDRAAQSLKSSSVWTAELKEEQHGTIPEGWRRGRSDMTGNQYGLR